MVIALALPAGKIRAMPQPLNKSPFAGPSIARMSIPESKPIRSSSIVTHRYLPVLPRGHSPWINLHEYLRRRPPCQFGELTDLRLDSGPVVLSPHLEVRDEVVHQALMED